MPKAEQLSAPLRVVSLLGKSLIEQDATCLLKRKLFSAVIFLVTMKLFKVDIKHPLMFSVLCTEAVSEECCISKPRVRTSPEANPQGSLRLGHVETRI